MEEATRGRPTALLVVLAVLLGTAAVWATYALARGGSGSGPSRPAGGTTDPVPTFVQTQDGGGPPSSDDNCPEHGGGSGGDGGDSGTNGSSNPSL
jgi:hypothetical protein